MDVRTTPKVVEKLTSARLGSAPESSEATDIGGVASSVVRRDMTVEPGEVANGVKDMDAPEVGARSTGGYGERGVGVRAEIEV